MEAAVASAAAGLSVEAWCGQLEIKRFCVCCVRDQQLGPAAIQTEGEEPTSAAVPPHWIRSDGRMHRQREEGEAHTYIYSEREERKE